MPLTHRAPPQPVRAVHVAEVAAAAQQLAAAMLVYLRTVLWGLEYPRGQYYRGLGQQGSPGLVEATPEGVGVGLGSGAYTAGGASPGTVAQKAVLLITRLGTKRPTQDTERPDWPARRYFDGVLLGTAPDGAAPPPRVPRPVEPTVPPMDTLDEETYRAYIEGWAHYLAHTLRWLVDRELHDYWEAVTRWPTGTLQHVYVEAKLAAVALPPPTPDADPVVVRAGFGTHAWTRGDEGKPVRLGHDPRIGYWVDDLA